jgi:hypothetical protein
MVTWLVATLGLILALPAAIYYSLKLREHRLLSNRDRKLSEQKRSQPARIYSAVGKARIPSEVEIIRRREEKEWMSRR